MYDVNMTKEHNINDEPPHAVATTRFTTELKKNPHIAVKKTVNTDDGGRRWLDGTRKLVVAVT